MSGITRRTFATALAAGTIAAPSILRAQTKPIQIGIISDMVGPYRELRRTR